MGVSINKDAVINVSEMPPGETWPLDKLERSEHKKKTALRTERDRLPKHSMFPPLILKTLLPPHT